MLADPTPLDPPEASLESLAVPSRGGWLRGARLDPITGLVAFPDFHRAFGHHLLAALDAGLAVGVGIGDVDHLKAHVENTVSVWAARLG